MPSCGRWPQFAKILGYPLKRCESRRDLQGLLNRVAGRPHERAINFALLRSLKQAEYTVADVGHYALGVEHYCHFTSPIRRYPDLTVHRTVADVLFHRKSRRGGDVVELAKTRPPLLDDRAARPRRPSASWSRSSC